MLSVAVLDDYQGFAEGPFSKLDPSKFTVSYFPHTLKPFNHANTEDAERAELVARLEPFDIICTMRERTPFPRDLVQALPRLKLLLTTSRRNLSFDMAALAARQIRVAGTSAMPVVSGGSDSTTQHTVSLILALARALPASQRAWATGAWQTRQTVAVNLSGKTLGVVGLGRLGGTVARSMVAAFGMRVVAWSPGLTQERADAAARDLGLPVEMEGCKTFRCVSREEVFAADVVTLHLVLSERTRGLIGPEDLGRMKPSAILVNTSRGPLVQEKALLDVLQAGKIRGAALDVWEPEPVEADSVWRTTKWGQDGRSEVLATPHMGYVEEELMQQWYREQAANIEKWERGEKMTMEFRVD
ncbi:hypothetical protein TD95_002914 [Thielaviopsis punctulata]|uniref:D-isomer specific 2-hydroxyacid dehydrogenase NAD-binding domain-containing protein n=1 Tax=Thielaviopsis punctulata TaxID=72032 RepID=A0A0F4ZED2_9PEZI|nr:hypothetical protein TD95_002914 [Thielaviopsis punctulata]